MNDTTPNSIFPTTQVFYSYAIGSVYILAGTLVSGEFFQAVVFFAQVRGFFIERF